MTFTYENQGTSTFLVYTLGMNESVDTMSLGMITNNRIPGIASTVFMQLDSNKFIKYNVSSKIPVSQFFSGSVNRVRLIGVFGGIVDAMLSAEEYMIDPNTILLDMDYIFTDVSSCATVLVCIPIVGKTLNHQEMGTFFKNIMFSTQFDQTENCDYVGKIINYLNSASAFSLLDFRKILDEIKASGQKGVSERPASREAAPQVQAPLPAAQQTIILSSQQSAAAPQPAVPQKVQSSVPDRVEIPGKQKEPIQDKKDPKNGTKKISMFYLLQHYNKENAEAYKAQKTEKKAKAAEEKGKHDKKSKGGKKEAASSVPGFAIPGMQGTTASTSTRQESDTGQSLAVQPTVLQPTVTQPLPAYMPPQPSAGQSANFGETTVLNLAKIGETTVLSSSAVNAPAYPHLIRMKNNERIEIDKPVFRIGKEKSYVDYFISDNSAISRSHANILIREGEYFIVDTNSTNHTYINGALIQSNMEVKLVSGTKIRLANEEFEFKL